MKKSTIFSASAVRLVFIRTKARKFFTLSELLIASAILGMIVASLSPLALTTYRNYVVAEVRSTFESEILTTQEWVKRDMSSSSRDRFLLYPEGRVTGLEAISLPVLRRGGDATGSPVDSDNQIQWTHTVIYHLFELENDTWELRRTAFHPRDRELSDEERYKQLEDVHRDGNGNGTFNGRNASTQTLLSNITNHLLRSQGGEVDTYAPGSYNVVEYHSIGTWIIEPGENEYKFVVSGKNERSGGYDIGIDEILVSATGLGADAECLEPGPSQGGTPESQSMKDFSGWSNNAELYFAGGTDNYNNYMSVKIYNDSWVESTFVNDQARARRAEIRYSEELGEIVCRMIGLVPSWMAQVQSLNQVSHDDTGNYNNRNIRVIISGSEETLGENILHPGKKASVTFRSSSSNPLHIQEAYIMKRDMDCELGYNGTGPVHQLTFTDDNDTNLQLNANETITSNYVDLEIEPGQDYLVSYYTTPGTGNSRTTSWEDLEGRTNSFVFHLTDEDGNNVNIADEESWTDVIESHGDDGLQMLSRIVGVENVTIGYPESATYTSRIVDTRQRNPDYRSISWRHEGSSDTDIKLRVRAGDQPNLSDAVDWEYAPLFNSPAEGAHLGGNILGRFVQWQAELISEDPYMQTPILRDVELRWEGERRSVDVTVAVGKGPDRGIFELKVNDEEPQPAQLLMQFSMGKKVRDTMYSRDFAVEITPRN